jgi:DNA-binding NarL/FixJ family response regulator
MPDATALPSRLFDFVGHVARAGDVEELQQRYLDGVGEFVSSAAAGLYVLDPFTGTAQAIAARGVSDFFLARYEESGRRQDPVLRSVVDTRAVVDNAQLMTADAWRGLPVYDRVFRLHRISHLLQAPLVVDDQVLGTLNFARTDGDGVFAREDRAVVETIARLLSVALEAVRAHATLRRERDQVAAALELCSDAVIITDVGSAQRRMNGAARRLLARLPDGEAAVDDLLVHPVRDAGGVSRCEVPVTCVDGTAAVLAGRSSAAAGSPALLVTFLELVGDGAGGGRLPVDGLTPRELEVARLAAHGLRDPEIAARLQLSPYTVKQYLRAVYGKLGVRSRIALTRLDD